MGELQLQPAGMHLSALGLMSNVAVQCDVVPTMRWQPLPLGPNQTEGELSGITVTENLVCSGHGR